LARCTRPDIAFAVHQLIRRTHATRKSDQLLAKRILRYLAGTASTKLVSMYTTANGYVLSAFTDADYAANNDQKAISACKQSNISLSSMESEFVAVARGVQELLGSYVTPGNWVYTRASTANQDGQSSRYFPDCVRSILSAVETHRHQVQVFKRPLFETNSRSSTRVDEVYAG
jgi:hypothetical protein